MLWLALAAPFALAGAAFAVPSARLRPPLFLAGAILHAFAVAGCWAAPPAAVLPGWLALDALGKVTLTTLSLLFLACAVYAQGYLARHPLRDNRVFIGCLLLALGAMTMVTLAQHLGLLWVAIEATTLATAPLIFFNHNARSLEATWKYLLICSVGIALALLGTFCLALSGVGPGGPHTLALLPLLAGGHFLSRPWVEIAFVFLVVGYGTKMGLAPLHSWKPDAYGEAPGLVGALLAGALTNCAFLAILRVVEVCNAAGAGDFARDALLALGLASMAFAGAFMVGQSDFKRMLAYSSVEHMGILALGVALGGGAVAGAMFHTLNNGLTKGVLFLSAGNIQRSFGSKLTSRVHGAARRLPLSGALFVGGFLAITGSPPFSPFLSEFAILNGALGAGRYAVGGLFLLFLAVVFVGMAVTVLHVVQGDPSDAPEVPGMGERVLTALPPLALLLIILALGLFLPRPLRELFDAAAAMVRS